MRCDFTKKVFDVKFCKNGNFAICCCYLSLVSFPIYWRNLAFYRRKSSRKLGCKEGYQIDRYKKLWIVFGKYSYYTSTGALSTSPAANPMRDVFPVFSRNYAFFAFFCEIDWKKYVNLGSLLHYNYKYAHWQKCLGNIKTFLNEKKKICASNPIQ